MPLQLLLHTFFREPAQGSQYVKQYARNWIDLTLRVNIFTKYWIHSIHRIQTINEKNIRKPLYSSNDILSKKMSLKVAFGTDIFKDFTKISSFLRTNVRWWSINHYYNLVCLHQYETDKTYLRNFHTTKELQHRRSECIRCGQEATFKSRW